MLNIDIMFFKTKLMDHYQIDSSSKSYNYLSFNNNNID